MSTTTTGRGVRVVTEIREPRRVAPVQVRSVRPGYVRPGSRAARCAAAGSRHPALRSVSRPAAGSAYPQPVHRPLRLTRRGRVVVWLMSVLVLAALVVAGVLLAGGTAQASRPAKALPVQYHVLMPGETLWGLAAQLAPSADPRDVVAQIIELNSLTGAEVRAGTRLALPSEG